MWLLCVCVEVSEEKQVGERKKGGGEGGEEEWGEKGGGGGGIGGEVVGVAEEIESNRNKKMSL